MKHIIHHGLEPALARTATQKALETYQERFAQYNPTVNWRGDDQADVAFSAKGMTLNGSIEIQPKDIAIELEVPFLLRPFKNKAIGIIETEIREWVERARNGEL